jgi:AraC family transcriptional activator of pobA
MARSAATRKRGNPRTASRSSAGIPVFSLYGEALEPAPDSFVHIEPIATRSERYRWEIDRHVHQGLRQVLVVLSGGVTLSLDDAVSAPAAPCAVIVPSSTVHAFRFLPGTAGRVLTFTDSLPASGAPELRAVIDALCAAPAVIDLAMSDGGRERLARLLDDIGDELRERSLGWTAMLEWQVASVLLLLARLRSSALAEAATGQPYRELFARFKALVETSFAEHRPLAFYADRLGVTESRLNRAARAVAGKSAFEAVQDRLLLEARRKLVYIAAPVSTLAYELGFDDPAYFWRFFRRRMGMTPTEFRQAARRRAGEER